MLLDDAQSIRPQLDTETRMGPCYSTELLTICTESILNKKESKCAYMMLFIIYSFHQVQWYNIIQCISIDSKPCICVASWTNWCVPFVKENSKKTTPGGVFDQIGHVLNVLIHMPMMGCWKGPRYFKSNEMWRINLETRLQIIMRGIEYLLCLFTRARYTITLVVPTLQ